MDLLSDWVVKVGSILGFVSGVILLGQQISRVFKKKPRFDITNIKTNIDSQYLSVECEIWNGRTRWQRRRTSNASLVRVDIQIIDRQSTIKDSKNLNYSSKIIIPGTCVKLYKTFVYQEGFESVNINVSCEEGSSIRKTVKISDYLKQEGG